nr:MAG TPA: hypothetical protein [Caudoviricetes sp.]
MKPIRSGAKLTVTIKQAAYSGQRDKAACLFFIIQNCYYEQGHSQNDHEFFICTHKRHPFYRIRTDDCIPSRLPG